MAIVADRSGVNPTDLKYASPNRTGANLAAVVAFTPLYPGEIVLDLATGNRYRGILPIAGGWGLVTSSMPLPGGG